MKMHSWLATSLLLIVAQPALSFVGPEALLQAPSADSTCRILTYTPSGSVTSICTGTLISATEVSTAGHCARAFTPPNSGTVECGYRGVDQAHLKMKTTVKGTDVFVEGVLFAESARVTSAQLHPRFSDEFDWDYESDFGLLHLDHPLSITPMIVTDRFDLNETKSCVVGGYGFNNQGMAGILKAGELLTTQLTKEDRVSFTMSVTVSSEDHTVEREQGDDPPPTSAWLKRSLLRYAQTQSTSIQAMLGDSGGGMFCQNSADHFELVGVFKAMWANEKPDNVIEYKSDYNLITKAIIDLLRGQKPLE